MIGKGYSWCQRMIFVGLILLVVCTCLIWLQPTKDQLVTSKQADTTSSPQALRKSKEPEISVVMRRPTEPTLAQIRRKLADWFETNTGETDRQEALTQDMLELLNDKNIAETILALTEREFDTPFGTLAFDRWLKIEPLRAALWIADHYNPRDENASSVAKALLQTPEILYRYCDDLPETEWKRRVVEVASLEAIAKDRVVAFALAERLTSPQAKINVMETIAYEWFVSDPDSALKWTQTMADPALRERLFAVGAKAIAVTDPDLAAHWLSAAVKSDSVLPSAVISLVGIWADHHPQKAAVWVSQFGGGETRLEAIEIVMTSWEKIDRSAANTWLNTLPEREQIVARRRSEGPD